MPELTPMKLIIVFCFLGAAIGAEVRGEEKVVRYSGNSNVPGLGTVLFPGGEWFLEFRRPPPNPNPAGRPDYFGFRKVGETPERLGFRRYDVDSAPVQLSHLMDGILETLGEGAPAEELGVREFGESNLLRMEPDASRLKPSDSDIWLSFINIRPSRPLNWLCHAHLYAKEGWVFAIVHASSAVLNPEIVATVSWTSKHDKAK